MENQTNIETSNSSTNLDSPINAVPILTEKPKTNYWKITTIALGLIFVPFIIYIGLMLLAIEKPLPARQPVKEVITETTSKITITGVIRSSGLGGLSEDEKLKFGSSVPLYQLTDFIDLANSNSNNQVEGLSITGYYLAPSDININFNFNNFAGKCVSIEGMPSFFVNSKDANTIDGYNHSMLTVYSIKQVAMTECKPYVKLPIETTNEISPDIVLETMTGRLVRMERPAPDISYDYNLVLDKPFVDNNNASGVPQELNVVVVSPSTNDLWEKFEASINTDITVKGPMSWGYAESRFLSVTEIQ